MHLTPEPISGSWQHKSDYEYHGDQGHNVGFNDKMTEASIEFKLVSDNIICVLNNLV